MRLGRAYLALVADLDRTLYVRTDAPLVDALDARLAEENRSRPGAKLSRADLIRSLLWAALGASFDPAERAA